jgi:hypothetical protein
MTEWSDELDQAWVAGFLAAVCGIDASGKSTVLDTLQARLVGGGAGGGGGGGASYVGPLTNASTNNAARSGDGQIVISWQ